MLSGVVGRGRTEVLCYPDVLLKDLKLVGRVNSLEDADNVRYDSARNLLYVGYGWGALAVIDLARSVKIAEIPLDGHPESFPTGAEGKPHLRKRSGR